MAKRQTAPDTLPAPEVGDDAAAILAGRQKRLAELRARLTELDRAEQEIAGAIAFAIADGGTDPEPLRAEWRRIREELEDTLVAVPPLEGLVRLAEEGVKEERLAAARAEYAVAREKEADAATVAVDALRRAADALRALHAAGRVSYQAGQAAGVENAASYTRRTRTVVNFVHSAIGEVLPALSLPNAYRVEDLPARLNELLPPVVETVEE